MILFAHTPFASSDFVNVWQALLHHNGDYVEARIGRSSGRVRQMAPVINTVMRAKSVTFTVLMLILDLLLLSILMEASFSG